MMEKSFCVYSRLVILALMILSCSKEDNSNVETSTFPFESEPNQVSSSSSNQELSTSSPVNSNYVCGNGYFYLSRPEAVDADNLYRYYEYAWQSNPEICLKAYQPSLLGNRLEKVQGCIDWLKIYMPNIIPVNVFYVDQVNASDETKNQFDTDFCSLVREPNDVVDCVNESAGSWGERSHGAGVYGSYLHNGADLMIYDDAFKHSEGVDAGMYYLNHEYFHTFQTSHMFYFEERNQFGISISDESENISLPFLPIWLGEGGADFASIPMMAKQNLDFDPYEQAITKLDQARRALEGSNSSFSLEDFETENTRLNDEYYAYGGGLMAHVFLWHLNDDNFKKLMVDFYSIFAEKYKLNPQSGWQDAFEETFGITLAKFYSDFDNFMRQDRDSQVAIIKPSVEWENASWD